MRRAPTRFPDDVMYNGIMAGHKANQAIIEFIKGIQAEIGKAKFSYPSNEPDEDMLNAVKEFAIDDIRAALDTDDKNVRDERLAPIYEKVHEKFDEVYPDQAAKIDECLYKTQKYVVRRWLLDEQKRVDGRKMDEIRPLAAEVGLLPRVHGSGMFTRGQTQVLTIATLGSARRRSRPSTASTRRDASATSISTTCRPTPSAKQSRAAARAAVKSATAPSRSAHSCRCSRLLTNSRTPCALFPKCSLPTAPRRRLPSAVPRWR